MPDKKLFVLFSVFLTALIAANLLGTKITYLFSFSVSVGIFAVPFTFLITDIIEEVYGRKTTRLFVYGGVCALVLLFLFVLLAVHLPAHPRYAFDVEYKQVLGASLRMIVASILAFFFAQMHDIWAFNFWKKRTKGRLLWLRNNLSTMVSQLIDTTLFMFIAFYHVTPKFTAGFVLTMIVPYWLFKVLFAVLDTPLVYLGVWWLKKDRTSETR